jgi:hypothetical protein
LRPSSSIDFGDSSLARKAIRPDPISLIMRNQVMKNDRPEPNAELQSYEPLRVTFAVLALLLGLAAALHV